MPLDRTYFYHDLLYQGKRQKTQEADQADSAAATAMDKEPVAVVASTPGAEGQAASQKAERDRGGKKLSREERARQREFAAEGKRRKERQQAFWRYARP